MSNAYRGVGGLEFQGMEMIDPAEINRQIKKTLKKERRKDEAGREMEALSDVMVMQAIGQANQIYIDILTKPPVDGASRPITSVDTVNWGPNNAALLKWAVNSLVQNTLASYNAMNALRAEVFIALFDHGLSHKKRRGGLFGGGVGGLFFLSFIGGGLGFSNLFGGQIVCTQDGWSGLG